MFFSKKNYFLNLCILLMFLGVFLGMNSVSWLMMWFSMEITLMFFIPMLMLNKSMIESFSCLKYFIFQCLGSIFFIMGSMNFFYFTTFGLFFKLGIFPNHFWMLSVSKGLNWKSYFLFMTVQKFLPLLFLIFSLKFNFFFIMNLIYLNSLIGNLGSMNQMDMRLLMTFSSMNHTSWMVLSSMMNMYMFYLYFFLYSLLMFFLFIFFKKMNIFFMFQIFYMKNYTLKYTYLMIFMLFFSFMGFPPFLGFLMKLISMMSLLMFFFFIYLFMMLLQNLFISFSYVRVIMYLFFNVSRSFILNKMNLSNYINLINMSMLLLLL